MRVKGADVSQLSDIHGRLRAFIKDEHGAAGVEFIMTLPLLIGALVLTAEYGKALRYRMVLTAATADVTSFLARAPLAGDPTSPSTASFYPEFVALANTIMEQRLGRPVTLTPSVFEDSNDLGLRSETILIDVQTAVDVELPLLGWINITWAWANDLPRIFGDSSARSTPIDTEVTIAASVRTRWFHDVSQLGQADCSNAERAQQLCGTSSVSAGGST